MKDPEGRWNSEEVFLLKKVKKILIIEDVLSTGGSLKEVINLINNYDADIVGIGVVVDQIRLI